MAIATSLLMVGAIVGSLLLSRLLFVAVVFLLVVVSLAELLAVLRHRVARPAVPVVYASAVVLVFGAWQFGVPALSFGILVTLLAGFAWYLFDIGRAEVTRNLAATLLASVYIPFTAAHLVLVVRESPDHVGAILGYALLVIIYDTAAYAVGASVGRRRFAPSISPGKSVEGAVGATVATLVVGALVLPLWAPWTLAVGLTMALVTVVVAPLGDLAESMIKRDLAVKDMSSFLPGHGGFLDRMDAMLLVAPALYYVLTVYGAL